MNFEAVAGHAATIATLRRQMTLQTMPHALLLTGPDRVGKTTVALALATEVLAAEEWPGGLAAHPDLWVEDGDGERIGIDRIRAGGKSDAGVSLQDFLSRKPFAGGARVAIIARADRLTEQAANCLLKTLEEPPSQTHLVLGAAIPDRLPETIRSRCQTLPLAPLAPEEIASWLRSRGIPDVATGIVSLVAVGRPGRALRLATDPGALGTELDALDGFIASAGGDMRRCLEQSGKLAPPASADGRERAEMQLGVWTSFLRDLSCYCHDVPELAVWEDYSGVLAAWAAKTSPRRSVAMLDACLNARDAISAYANPRLTYDVLFVELFGARGELPATPAPLRDAAIAAFSSASAATAGTRARPARVRRAR